MEPIVCPIGTSGERCAPDPACETGVRFPGEPGCRPLDEPCAGLWPVSRPSGRPLVFVSAEAGPAGDGTEALPFRSIEDAIRFAWNNHGLVVEPGGAAALAALLAGKSEPGDGTVVILSGGNVDPELHARIVGA